MAKHFKLNIKNAQLAEALKGKAPAAPAADKKPAARVVKPAEPEAPAASESAIVVKRKSRIVQQTPPPAPEVAAPVEPEPVAEEPPAPESEVVPETAAPSQPTPPPAPPTQTYQQRPAYPSSQQRPSYPSSQPRPAYPSTGYRPGPQRPAGPPSTRPPVARPPLPDTSAPRKDTKPKELRPTPGKPKEARGFDVRDRQGLRNIDDEAWRKKRAFKPAYRRGEEPVMRPKSLSVRIPIAVKDLAAEMKLKASQLIAKLFMKGIIKTLNDPLDDETVIQMLGLDFECEITIDTSEEQRIRITDQTIKQEIGKAKQENLQIRPPVIAFMGHVDHGKTSLIDAIRKSNRAAHEAGAITQHIGAFRVTTPAGDVAILDTPGHEAFTEMRTRGANVTDIVVLVVAGDEGVRAQTEEAIRQAREAGVTIVVALNKCDKPGFDESRVYRELADRDLLPESWGGTTLVVHTSATTHQGIPELLEMIALQAEVLELKADPTNRARGTVLESEMHKGLGAVATILVQNGTLRKGDSLVFGHFYGRVKTMQDEFGRTVETAGPSTPVKITGLSELATAGQEFIVVKSEKEARELAEARSEGHKLSIQQAARMSSLDRMMAKREGSEVKILPAILRADVQGSLEALKNSLAKIQSKKVRLEVINTGVGEISESDAELAAASKAAIIGFHTTIESHAADLIKIKGIKLYTNDIIYHVVDEVKKMMRDLLDKIAQENDTGVAEVRNIFRSSQLGLIAGCHITSGVIKRNSLIRQVRKKEVIWKGKLASLKRMKEDAKEVKEGFDCGILLEGQKDVQEGDLFQAYEITYLEQEI